MLNLLSVDSLYLCNAFVAFDIATTCICVYVEDKWGCISGSELVDSLGCTDEQTQVGQGAVEPL